MAKKYFFFWNLYSSLYRLIDINSNNNTHIAPYGRNFRGAVASECASESEKKEVSKPVVKPTV